MAINLIVSNHVGISVKGVIDDEDGKPNPFAFFLKCKRLKSAELKVSLDDKETAIADFLEAVVVGWKNVKDAGGVDAEFSTEALRQLLELPGVARMAFIAYLASVGAKEKN